MNHRIFRGQRNQGIFILFSLTRFFYPILIFCLASMPLFAGLEAPVTDIPNLETGKIASDSPIATSANFVPMPPEAQFLFQQSGPRMALLAAPQGQNIEGTWALWSNGWTGTLVFTKRAGVWTGSVFYPALYVPAFGFPRWEPITVISFSPTTGALTLYRPSILDWGQNWYGTVNGNYMSGTFISAIYPGTPVYYWYANLISRPAHNLLSLTALPNPLLVDSSGAGAGMVFEGVTDGETDVSFSITQGGHNWDSGQIHTQVVNGQDVATVNWNGRFSDGTLVTPGFYTVIGRANNTLSKTFEVKKNINILSLITKPGALWVDRSGFTSGIIFRATTSEATNVTFIVQPPSGQAISLGSVNTQDVGNVQTAGVKWLALGLNLQSGSYTIIARIFNADGSIADEESKVFPVFRINAEALGYGSWLEGKDPASGQRQPSTPTSCPLHIWDQLITHIQPDFHALTVSDPVNAVFGNYLHEEVDLQLKGNNPLVLARIYNSLDPVVGPFGRGWSSPYLSRLELSENRVLFVNSDGERLLFTSTNGQTYQSPARTELKLAFSADTEFWTVSHPNGTEWSFDAGGKLLRMAKACCGHGATDAIMCEYSQTGHLARVFNGASQTLTFVTDTEGRFKTVTDSAGRVLTYSFEDGNLVSVVDPLGRMTAYQYSEEGFLTRIQKPGTRETTLSYVDHRISTITQPNGGITRLAWDEQNTKFILTDPVGTDHEYKFAADWVFSGYSVPALGLNKTFQVTNVGLEGFTNSLGAQEAFSFNASGLLERASDALGNVSLYEYHPTFNRLTKKTDTLGREWRYEWCQRGNLISETDPVGGKTLFTYDSHNNRVSKTDPLGRLQRWIYEGSGNYLIQAINPEGGISSFSYDNRGNLISSSDPLGRTTLFSFDLLDRLVKTIYADGRLVEVEYNEAGNVSVRRDNLGRETHYIYDLADRLTTLTRPDGTTFNYAYSAAGQKISETDSLGRVTRFEYSPIGLLTRTTYPDSSFETMTYDTESRLVSKTNELGQTTNLEYDQLGRLLATIDPSGARWESLFDSVGRKIADKDPLNRVTAYQFDNLDRITKVIRPDNSFVTSSFDAIGNLLGTVDALGNQWSWVYDSLNRQVAAIQPNGASSRTAFDAAGQVIEETDALNRTTRFSFDNGGRRTATIDALSNIWLNFYDGAGRLTAVKDPLGAVSSMSYDIMDRVISQSDALGNVNSLEFDSAGRRVAKTDAMGRRSITAYDLRDRVSSEVDPEGHTVSYGYNLAGQRVSLTDGANRTWRWEFDNLGRVTAEFDPLGNVNRSAFDSVGNRISSTNARNQTTAYAFNSMNHLSQISYPDSTIATMAYDLEGREISRSGVSGTVTKTWDSVGNMTSEAFGPWGKKWQYSFDLAGNRTQAIDPEGQIFKYSVDKLNRLVSLDPPDKGDEIKFSFDPAGRQVTKERPGVKTTNTFDLAGRLLEMRHERDHGREKIVALRQYQYNSVGTRISQTDENGEKTLFSFNNSDWLTKAVYPDGIQVSYSYNGAGDRISETTDTPTVKKVGRNTVLGTDTIVIPLAYDAGGRLISRASDTFTFDPDGNQVAAVENGDETRCFWNPDNRLVKVEKDIECPKHGKKKCHQCPQTQTYTVSESYAYLPNDWRRISRTADGKEYVSVFDSADESHEYQLKTRWDKDEDDDWRKCPEKDRNKPRLKLVRQFIGGPGTDDLELTRYHGRKLWTLKDGLGSTIALTNRGGNAVARIGYDAWGSFRWSDKPGHGVKPCRDEDLNDLLDRLDGGRSFEFSHDGHHYGRHFSAVFNPYLFTGRKIDAFSNLYNHRNRMMNPRLGHFISKDPIGFRGGLNLYSYANLNPVTFADPFGLIQWQTPGTAVGVPSQGPSGFGDVIGVDYLASTDLGHRIAVWQANPGYERRKTYWCHGLSFGGVSHGPRSPYADYVPTILQDEWDKLESCGNSLVGDIVVFYYPNGEVTHSGIIDRVEITNGKFDENLSWLNSKDVSRAERSNTFSLSVSDYFSKYSCYKRRGPSREGGCARKGTNEL